MNNIKLFADSTCDLPISEIQRMDIGIVPLVVTFGDDIYKEGLEITPQKLFELVKEKNMLPKTSAPSPVDFYLAFKPYIDEGKSIIYIGLSSKLSTTLQNARLSMDYFDNGCIKIVDSLNLCGAIGDLVRHAYNFIESGMSIDETVENLESIIPNYKLYFTVETLDYLHMGGRCSSTELVLGNALNIKPIISMSPKGLTVWKKTRGKKRAINMMIEEAINDRDRILFEEIHLACAIGNEHERDIVKNILIEKTGITKYNEYNTGCVISGHCGEGTIGFGYFLK